MNTIKTIELPYFENPFLLFEKIVNCRWPILLDSHHATTHHRFDIMVCEPIETITNTSPQPLKSFFQTPFPADNYRANDIPFAGGAVGYWSYDLDMAVGIYDFAIVTDHLKKETFIASYLTQPSTRQTIQNIKDIILNNHLNISDDFFQLTSTFESNFDQKSYQSAFLKIKDYLLSGDCYQINLTQKFTASCIGSLTTIYPKLQKYNPAPFSALMLLPELEILSCSPERFLQVKNNIVTTQPIKGTRRRSEDMNTDQALKQQLKNSEKDRAENVMIVDLLRNDLSRTCKPGTVVVTELCEIHSFANVHHLISSIQGELMPHYHAIDLFQHCFPGGSITGTPKKRAMEIIAELEPDARDIYCGSIGYIGFDGNMDCNIAIRTLVHDKNKHKIYCGAGGAIVLDSDCEQEFQECLDKVGNLFAILGSD